MHVPLIDIKAQNRSLASEISQAVGQAIEQGQFILGPAVERFERQFAEFVGARHCIGLNSGTSALHLAMLAAGLRPGDEVITTPLTWISTSWAISYLGARPVFVDVDQTSRTIDPTLVEQAITRRTRAILPVHLYGRMCDMAALTDIANRHNLVLIEDAAQAHGACLGGRPAGCWGNASCFSFYPGKNLGALGEGGAVTTSDDALAARIRRLRDHAQDGRHHHVEIGFNYRMEGLQGAALAVKLPRLTEWNRRRHRLARRYDELLRDSDGLMLPKIPPAAEHAWHLYVVRLAGAERGAVMRRLTEAGVGCAIHYPNLVPLQPAYSHLGHRAGDFPQAEAIAADCLSLPLFPEMTDAQQDHVVQAVLEAVAEPARRTSAAWAA